MNSPNRASTALKPVKSIVQIPVQEVGSLFRGLPQGNPEHSLAADTQVVHRKDLEIEVLEDLPVIILVAMAIRQWTPSKSTVPSNCASPVYSSDARVKYALGPQAPLGSSC